MPYFEQMNNGRVMLDLVVADPAVREALLDELRARFKPV